MGMAMRDTSRQSGFSVVELLLAVAVFGFLAMAVIGALVYGRASTAGSGDRVRANALAEEGVEAVRNIRDAGYANISDGTYGLVQSGNVWTLSGAADTSDIYNRSVTVSSDGANRKNVVSTVSWAGAQGTGSTSVVGRLTNWLSATKKWATPSQYASLDVTGNIAGSKVATSGSYAYMIRRSATGPNFLVVNIATPSSPTVVGALTLAGTPTNIAISGSYAYVSNISNTAELQIVRISTPASPTLAGSYDAAGTADGLGVTAVGTDVFLTRAANGNSDEFVIVNAASPSSPARTGGYSSNIIMNEVYVYGSSAYVATSSNTAEVVTLNIANLSSPSLQSTYDMPGNGDATAIDGKDRTLIVGQGTSLYAAVMTIAAQVQSSGTVTMPGTISDVSYDTTHNYAMVGTNFANGEFQAVNVDPVTTPVLLGSVNLAGSVTLAGVAYNAAYDVVAGANSSTTQEAVVLGPN